ncbi:hypothetical protein BC831DRAFT_311434 [Entophlyctis helioformis]|nr:hypothetical protein BC831DRAFT_311434 [Entophlyctis helioformis]
MSNAQAYVSQVIGAFTKQQGDKLAELLSVDGEHLARLAPLSASVLQTLRHTASSKVRGPWQAVLCLHIDVIESLQASDDASAAAHQNALAQSFYQIFTTQTNWCLPVLYTITHDLRALSIRADAALAAAGEQTGRLEEAARTMNRMFAACATDRLSPIDSSRKWGTYYIVNILFKTYFKLNSTNLCATILRSLKSADVPNVSQFPRSHLVTYKYYTGVLSFYNERYDAAATDLAFASAACLHPLTTGRRNKLHILNYLLPAQLVRGVLPHNRLFEKYPDLAADYEDIVVAVRTGNLGLFDAALERCQDALISRGTWLTVESLRPLVLRTLFRSIWVIQGKGTRIPFAVFQRGIEVAMGNKAIELAQVECYLAIMIDKGYMKGYLSHDRLMAVLSNKDPFPSIASVQVQS